MNIKLKSISNLRDLGGIPAGGGAVKPGLLFRSGHHAGLSAPDADALRERLGIGSIADLRSDSEVAERPDIRADGISYLRFPSLTDEQNPSVNKENRLTILRGLMEREGGTRAYLRGNYRIMVSSPAALGAYGSLVRLLVDNGGKSGVLWHCTQGKDRAGIGAAVVLMALGAGRDEIEKDYMRSNRAFLIKNSLIFLGVTAAAHSIATAAALNNLLCARHEYLAAAFAELDSLFGGTEGFLHDALGLTDRELERLRGAYLA